MLAPAISVLDGETRALTAWRITAKYFVNNADIGSNDMTVEAPNKKWQAYQELHVAAFGAARARIGARDEVAQQWRHSAEYLDLRRSAALVRAYPTMSPERLA